MEVFIFKGVGVHGFTSDQTGKNLPAEFGPWNFIRSEAMNAGEGPRIGVNTDDCLVDIERKGFHISDAQIVISRRGA
jgi:hypothetical protein